MEYEHTKNKKTRRRQDGKIKASDQSSRIIFLWKFFTFSCSYFLIL